jgi:hypothetical protein
MNDSVTGCSEALQRKRQPFGAWFPNATRVPGARYDKVNLTKAYVYETLTTATETAAATVTTSYACRNSDVLLFLYIQRHFVCAVLSRGML